MRGNIFTTIARIRRLLRQRVLGLFSTQKFNFNDFYLIFFYSDHRFGDERYLSISKRNDDIETSEQTLDFSPESQKLVIDLRKALSEGKRLNQRLNQSSGNSRHNSRQFYCRSDRLSNGRNAFPPPMRGPTVADYKTFRKELPIFCFRDQILETIGCNQVVVISGDTGCGKTTQLPQYLLEFCAQTQSPCRIVCCEPRRLAAISVAERICFERNETIGRTVGYQIRLESR